MTRHFAGLLASTMLAAITACSTPPPPALDLSLSHLSKQDRFMVTLVPPEGDIGVQQFQTWQIRLATPAGVPIPRALVYLNGGMPEHGHGLPTRPAVAREIAPGTYLLEGVKFSMPGWWELIVAIQVNGMEDMAYFNKIVPVPASGR
ncbi:MAG: FixH family protein [Betaproteobacteria bacterium]